MKKQRERENTPCRPLETIVGNNQAGFTIAFAKDSETVIDAEFKAQPMDKEGTLILYTEDIDKTE